MPKLHTKILADFEPSVTIGKRCGICSKVCYVRIKESKHRMWLAGVLAADDLGLPREERIPLISGLCSECHDSLQAERSEQNGHC